MAVADRRFDGMELWVNLARRTPSPYEAAPLSVAAWCAFRDGNGALAALAAEKAVQSTPGYRAAELVPEGLSSASTRAVRLGWSPKSDLTTTE